MYVQLHDAVADQTCGARRLLGCLDENGPPHAALHYYYCVIVLAFRRHNILIFALVYCYGEGLVSNQASID